MEKIKGFLKSRKTASFLLSFVITLIIDISIVLVRHSIINISFVLTFFTLPLIGLYLIFRLIFSHKKIIVKTVLSVITAIVTLALIFGFFMVGYFEELTSYKNEKAEQAYSEIESTGMIELSEVGNPISMEYHYYYSAQFIFSNEAYTLICKYDEENYEKQKTLLDGKYVFRNLDGMKVWAPTTIDGYEFRMLSIEEDDLENVVFIATNDETKEVVYMNFYDDDLDYIDSLEEFIENDCGWKYIR